ncbi:hypothetical protein Q7P37_008876 [Cladosporium fusiforme]
MSTRTSLQYSNSFAPSASTTKMSPKPEPKVRSYKDFLTPAMHRRFTGATGAALLLCYTEAVLISDGNLFWRMFIFGLPGIRTMLLSLTVLAVFIIRLANLHVGERNTTSGLETFVQHLTTLRTYHTLAWYIFSAFFFGEVYIWSRAQESYLGWIDHGRPYERPRLNENPILLRCLYMCLAIWQTGVHLYSERDTVQLLEKKKAGSNGSAEEGSKSMSPMAKLREKVPSVAQSSFQLAVWGLVTITPIYFTIVRRPAWSLFSTIGSLYHRHLPNNAPPSGLVHLPGLMWQGGSSSFMLIFLWEISNTIFTLYVAEPPLKKNNPLTSEIKDNAGSSVSRSQDPNGSLLNGLKSKKELPRTFAFWELYLICTDFAARRKSIFTEVDRKTGSTWTQISTACLGEIEAIRTRIRESQDPVEGRAKMAAEELSRKQQEHLIGHPQAAPIGLPRIANQGVTEGEVFSKQPSSITQEVGNYIKSVGQSPNSRNSLTPKRAIEWGTDRVLSKEQQAQLSKQALSKETNGYMLKLLKTPLGEPLRQTFARLANAVIFGVPRSNRVNITHAIRALADLVLASLEEDDYGQAAKDVPAIIRTYTATITEIQHFLQVLDPSWTDVEFDQRRSRNVPEVAEVLKDLKDQLERMVLAFGEYAGSLGLSRKEVREAKEAVGKGVGNEMMQTK